jgi:hypothetical protein
MHDYPGSSERGTPPGTMTILPPTFLTARLARIAVVTACAVLGTLLLARPAHAGPLVASAPDCDDQVLSRPFLPWVDVANYTPHPGGGFEGALDGWRLGDDAKVVKGNEPFAVASADDARSLSLPAGAHATSSTICVGLGHPTLRLFARRTSGSILSTLRVEVLFETAWGSVLSLPIGLVTGSDEWAPTLPMLIVANLLPLLPGDRTPVAFRFTALGGDWLVDDVFVDPWRAR